MQQPTDISAITLRDYARVVWLHKWLVLAIAIICGGGAFAFASTKPTMYEASTRLMYESPANPSDRAGSRSVDLDTISVQLQSVVNVISTPAVTKLAQAKLPDGVADLPYTVTGKVVQPADPAGNITVAQIVDITAETTDPQAAASVANAYADSVIALRKQNDQNRFRKAQEVVQSQLQLFTTAASKLTTDYAILREQLRNLQIAEATATGDFTVIVPASPPPSPSSPHPKRDAALGLVVGLVLGVAAAFVVNQFDTRVRSHREASFLLRLPVIGRIPRVARRTLNSDPLIAASSPEAPASEALRVLRSSLDWAGIDDHLRCLLVTSCAKGEGKTFTACNLAVTLARAGKRVVIVDADLRDPQVHRVFNISNTVGFTSVILGRLPFEQAAHSLGNGRLQDSRPWHTSDGVSLSSVAASSGRQPQGGVGGGRGNSADGLLRVLTSGPLPPNPGEIVASKRVTGWFHALAETDVDYIIVDSPPILAVGDTGALASVVDAMLIVVNLDVVKRQTLLDARDALEQLPCRKIGMVTNGEHFDGQEYRYAKRGSTR